jgi:serpin B
VNKLLAALNGNAWHDQLLSQLMSRKGMIVLPRFKLDYGVELQQPLQAMGMRLPFQPFDANFSGMCVKQVWVSAMRHKSFVEVDEEGTEAAAATVIVTTLGGRPEDRPFQMVVDRPFVFVIADQGTKAILFLGVVFEPASAT